VAGPSRWVAAGVAAKASWTARHGVCGHACLEAAHGYDLLSRPDMEGEGAGSPAEDSIGAVVERVEGGG
jgi:hypothetical protein